MSLLLLGLAFAAEGTLVGYTFGDEDGAPVPGTVVTVADRQVPSDGDGRFELDLPEGVWEVTLRPPEASGLQGGRVLDVALVGGEVTEMLVTFRAEGDPSARVAAPERATAPDAPADDLASGDVTGRILDEEGAPVAGARLFVRGVDVQATSDDDGRYALTLPSGARELTVLRAGFATTAVAVEVPADGRLDHDIVLPPASAALEDVVITAPYVEGSVASLLDERRSSSAVADVLGAEEMSRAGAGDAASALSRVTGITVVGGRYVYVRGLGDRYSSALLNGSFLPSPEPERRVVPLDLFPSSILEGVVVQKSYSPDMPGEFGGGVVQLRTRKPPTAPEASVSLSGAYRHGTTFQQGLDDTNGPTDWLGFDGGFRDLPDAIVDASAEKALEESDRFFPDRGYTPEQLEALGEALPRRWNTRRRTLPPDAGASVSLGSGMENDTLALGGLAALTYGSTWQQLAFDRTYYIVGADEQLEVQNQYAFDQATHEVSLGAFATAGLDVGATTVRYTGMINRSSDDTARVYEGFNRDLGGDLRITRTRFVERQLSWHQLLGQHGIGDAVQVDWRAVVARADRDEPDRRETRYDYEEQLGTWLLSDRPEGNGVFTSALAEDTLELGADLTLFLPTWLDADRVDRGFFKVGASRFTRDRVVDTRRYKFFHKGDRSRDPDVLALSPDEVFVPENIGSDGFQFEEFTRQTDNYTAQQQLLATYGMLDVPLTPWARVMGGARVESSAQAVSTFELFNPDAAPVGAELDTVDVLPAASLTLSPLDDVQVRTSYGRTVSRPEFRELSPATFNDVTGGRLTFGNENLTRATIDHVDLRVDWFPGPGEVFSLSLFRKRFTDPIETIVVVSAQQSVTWANAGAATNDGVELEYRKDLPLNLYSAGNVALVASRIDLGDAGGIQTSDERPLQGQSPYVVNVQFGWDHPDRGDRFTVLYNVAGRRIVEVGAQGAPDTYALPVHQLDAVVRKDLGRGLALTVKGGNLLDSVARTMQGSEEVDAIRKGWRVGLGLSWSGR